MIYARQPTEEEREELERMRQQETGRVSQRAHMMQMSQNHHGVPKLSRIFKTSRVTIRFWIRRFDTLGPAGLYDKPRSGRPRKLGKKARDTVEKLMQGDPQNTGYLATFWTITMLLKVVKEQIDLCLSSGTLRNFLHQTGMRWGRPRLAMPRKTDPEKAMKQWLLAKAVVGSPQGTVILYADEARIQLLPLLRAMWHWAGQQVRVPTPGSNATRAIFGALNIRTGQWNYIFRERMRKEDFIAFLEYLLLVYSGPIILIVDNYSSHTAHAVREWLLVHPRLKLFFLPTYCSHLNPVEPIWLQLKNNIAANRLYASMKLLLETADKFFAQMTPQQSLIWAGIKL